VPPPPPPAPTDEANDGKGRPVQRPLVRAKQILKLVDLQDSSSYDAIKAAPQAVLDLLVLDENWAPVELSELGRAAENTPALTLGSPATTASSTVTTCKCTHNLPMLAIEGSSLTDCL
jgi:hypothetical protein